MSEKEMVEKPKSGNEDRDIHNDCESGSSKISEQLQPTENPTVISRILTRITTNTSIPDPGPPPDGGFRAWITCFCAWLAIMNTWGFVNSFGAFQTYYTAILPESPSTISWIGSTQAFLMFLLGAFSGRALDAGLFLPTVLVGSCFQLVGIFTMSLATKYWHLFLTQGVLTGIGGGIFFTPVMALVSTYFSKRRGMALGMATSGNSAGGIIYPLVVRQLLPKVGFGWTVRTLGFLNLVSLGFIVIVMKPRLPPRKAGPIIEWQAIKDVPYVLFVLGVCSCMAAIYFVFYYIASFARDIIRLPYTDSVNLVIVLNGVGFPARVLPGFVADRYLGVFNTFIPILAATVILIYCWAAVSGIAGFYVFTVIYGLFAAGWQSLFPTAIASLSDDLSKSGTRLGMAFSTISFAALIGGPIGGALIQTRDGAYWPGIIWSATSTLLGVGLIFASRVYKHGWTLRKKC